MNETVDVYGLGTLLYELLTGRPPFAGSTTAAILTSVSRQSPVSPRDLAPEIDRDLETICLKCLEKDSSRRYPTAKALEADLGAWLDGRPITARPLSPAARLWRWARRRPGTALAIGMVTLSLFALTVVSSVAALWIGHARDRAEAGETEARDRLRGSLVEQARNIRVTRRPGQRVASLFALGQSAEIGFSQDARDEAVAALALPDRTIKSRWNLGQDSPTSMSRIGFDPTQHFYVVEWKERDGLELRRIGSGELVASMPVDARTIGALVFSGDGHWFASRFLDTSIRVWKVGESQPVWTNYEHPHHDELGSERFGGDLAFTPDSSALGMTSEAGGYVLRSVMNGQLIWHWRDSRKPRMAEFSRDGKRVALSLFREFSHQDELVLLDAATGGSVSDRDGFRSISAFAWSPSGTRLALGEGNRIQVIDTESGRSLLQIAVPDAPIVQMEWSAGDEMLMGRTLWSYYAWDPYLGVPMMQWNDRYLPGGLYCGVDASGLRFSSVDESGTGTSWEWSLSPIHRLLRPGPSQFVMQVLESPGVLSFSSSGAHLAVGGMDRVYVLDVATGRPVFDEEIIDVTGIWNTVQFGEDPHTLFWHRSDVGLRQLQFKDAADGQWIPTEDRLLHAWDGSLLNDYDPTTKRLSLGNYEGGRFRLIDAESGTIEEEGVMPLVAELAFSPNGQQWLAARWPKGEDGDPALRLHSADGKERSLPFSSTYGGTVRWADKADRAVAVVGSDRVVVFSPNGTKSWYDLPPEFANGDGTFAISPSGDRIAAWNGHAFALFDGYTGALLCRLAEPPLFFGVVRELRFDPTGRRLAALRVNGAVSLWDLQTLKNELEAMGLGWP